MRHAKNLAIDCVVRKRLANCMHCLQITLNFQASIEGVRDWLERASRYSSRTSEHAVPADELDERDPELTSLMTDLFRGFGRALRLRVEGAEKVPPGAALLVGNQRLVPVHAMLTAVAMTDQFGAERPLYARAHPIFFATHATRRHAFRLGLLRAAHEGQERALRKGALVLVHPGRARRNFIRLALREQVPIIPVVASGTRELLISFGAPMRWTELTTSAAEDEHAVRRCYLEVEARMKSMAIRSVAGRPEPGKPRPAAERHLHVVRI